MAELYRWRQDLSLFWHGGIIEINRKQPCFLPTTVFAPSDRQMAYSLTQKKTKGDLKKTVIEQLYKHCVKNNSMVFSNALVKEIAKQVGFGNPYDATKIDDTGVLPQILIENDVFISHLGKGKHCFVPGINNAYHAFEEIEKKEPWPYTKSVLNEFGSSEGNILSVAYNQGIIRKFLYPKDNRANPNIYIANRTKGTFDYMIGQTEVKMNQVQMEIDMTMEYKNKVTIFEGKNKFPERFAIYQLFHPYLYYYHLKADNKLPIEQINCCYLLRKKSKNNEFSSIIKVYLYTFTNPHHMNSIKLIKSTEYQLIPSDDDA